MTQKAKLEYDNTSYEMGIIEGTYAERGVDIRSLRDHLHQRGGRHPSLPRIPDRTVG
jgi:hypothetical protein